jgi:Right handed beta helix region
MKRLPASFTLPALMILLPGSVDARVWDVFVDGSGDAPTIQAAIDSAAAGDVVRVGPGTYSGAGNQDISFRGKAIVVESVDGWETTIVQPASSFPRRCFRFDSGEGRSSVLDGFTLRDGLGQGSGVSCDGSSPTILRCMIFHNEAGSSLGGGFAALGGASPLFEQCTLAWNIAVDWGDAGGGYLDASQATFVSCTLTRNIGSFGAPFILDNGAACVFERCILSHQSYGLFWCRTGTETVSLSCCDVFGNDPGDYTGCIEGQNGVDGNFQADPLLCGVSYSAPDLRLDLASPCLDAPGCGLIGSLGIGCGAPPVAVGELPDLPWSRVKALYRGDGDKPSSSRSFPRSRAD